MSFEVVGRRYARAIFELAKESGKLATIAQELASFGEAYAMSEELRAALDNPLVPETAREAIVKDLGLRLGLSDLAQNSLKLLVRRRRLAAISDIARQLGRLVDEDGGRVRAVVTSATPLAEPYLKSLQGELERATGKKVSLETRLDPSIIAGIVTQIGDRVIDGSARARLAQFKDSLQRM